MDKVVHFEIPVEDEERAKEFYKKAFDWKINSMPEMSYHIVHTSEIDELNNIPKEIGAINGGMMKRNELIQSPVITINVESIKDALERIGELGGEIMGEIMEIGEMGFAAYFKDTEGNILGLWENKKKEMTEIDE